MSAASAEDLNHALLDDQVPPSTSTSSSPSFPSSTRKAASSTASSPPAGSRLLLGIRHPPGALQSFLILFLINLLNYIDRFIPSAVKRQLQASFAINDFESSLPLTAFILVFMLCCPLFGWLADKGWSRRGLIAAGVVSWSVLTALTAITPNYALFIVVRASIGIGEASYATVAPAILSDWYRPEDRSKVLGAFYVATPVGAALGYGLGGVLGELAGWRVAFVVLGLPGVLLGLLVLRTQDPPRGGTDRMSRADRSNMVAGVWVQQETQWEALLLLLRNPVFVVAAVGQVLSTFGTGGLGDWFPTYLQSEFKQGESSSGLGVGAATVVGGIGGSLLGSWLGERCRPVIRNSYFAVAGWGSAGAAVGALIIIAAVPPVTLVYALLVLAQLSLWCYLGPITALIANSVHSRHRTRAFAISTFAQHALGDAASPSILGAVSDATHSLPIAASIIPVVWMLAAAVWVGGSRLLSEADIKAAQGGDGLLDGEDDEDDQQGRSEGADAGDRYIGGKELGGAEGEGSALVSEEERKEEALEAVRSASHV